MLFVYFKLGLGYGCVVQGRIQEI